MASTMLFGSGDFCYMSEINVCVHVHLYRWFFWAKDFAKKAVKEFCTGKLSGRMGKKQLCILTWTAICSIPALGFLGLF